MSPSKNETPDEDEYRRFLSGQATSVISSKWGLLLIAILACLVYYDYTQIKMGEYRLLLCWILIAYAVAKGETTNPIWVKIAPIYFDLICASYIGASVYLTIICSELKDFILDSAPIQISLFSACMLGFHEKTYILIRNACFVILSTLALYFAGSWELLISKASQLIVGGGVGTIMFLLLGEKSFRNQFLINTKLNENSLRLNAHLESTKYDHQKSMILEGFEESETMPTHVAEALILKLDVIESSKIRDPNYQKYFQDFCEEVEEIFLDNMEVINSDHVLLQGKGFFIKSVGDAAIFSIGNPVHVPKSETFEQVTEFVISTIETIFDKHLGKIASATPVRYCIGVAYETVQGGFSGKRKGYDVNGRGQILAERYENLRKLFPALEISNPTGHFLIVQDKAKVFFQNDFTYSFRQVLCNKIRDDEDASHFWIIQTRKNTEAALKKIS